MDYTLAALKVFCAHLKHARHSASRNALTLGGIIFQRVWIQGIIVSADADASLILDDGTGLFRLTLTGDFLLRPWHLGMYVMVVGRCFVDSPNFPLIQVHKMVDLSSSPDREALWYLEVMEAYKMFYQDMVDDFL